MSLIAEVWTRPGAAVFEKVIAGLPVLSVTGTLRLANGAGSGVATLPSDFSRLGEIIERDPTNPANDVKTIVRIFDTEAVDPSVPVHEWLVDSVTDDLSSGTVVITGADLASLMDQATVEASDWNGSPFHVSTFPDWIWGGRNILSNPDFADGGVEATIYEITSNATGGSFTLSDGTDTTPALDWDASGSSVENALEAFAALTDMDVARTPETGTGSGEISWRITYVTPPIRPSVLTFNGAGLTGGTGTMANLDAGIRLANPWSKSQGADRQSNPKFHGTYNSPGISVVDSSVVTPPTGATYTARVFAASQFAGIQQVVNVTPGGLYQARIYIRSGSTTDPFRFIIRDIYENPIAGYPSVSGAFTVTAANVWEQIIIPDVRIPEGVEQIVFRLSYVGQGAPAATPFGVALAELDEGAPPTTVGEMMKVLLDDATVDHAPGLVWWENLAVPNTSYLDYSSFDATTDSNGDAWTHAALEWSVARGQTYQRVLDQFAAKLGYEWQVTADPADPDSGIYQLHIYNPNGLGTDRTTDDHPAVNLGQGTAAGPVTKRHVGANRMMVEGDGGQIARHISTPSTNTVGMVGGYLGDRNLAGLDTLTSVAGQRVDAALLAGLSIEVTQVGGEWSTPLRDFGVGDRVNVTIPGVIPKSDHRVVSVTYTINSEGADRFGVQFSSEQFGSVAPSGGSAPSGGGVPVTGGSRRRASGGFQSGAGDGSVNPIAGSVRPLSGVSAREFAPVAEAARRYLTEFRGLPMPQTGGQGVLLPGATIPWMVASSNSPQAFQTMAGGGVARFSSDFDAAPLIQACLTQHQVCWVAFGNYRIRSTINLGNGQQLIGIGLPTLAEVNNTADPVLSVTGRAILRDMFLSTGGSSSSRCVIVSGPFPGAYFENVSAASSNGVALSLVDVAGFTWIRGFADAGNSSAILMQGDVGDILIDNVDVINSSSSAAILITAT